MPKYPDRPPLSSPALAERSGFPARGLPFSLTLHILIIGAALLLRFAPAFQFDRPTRRPPRTLAVVLPLESIQSPSSGQSGHPGTPAPSTPSHAAATRSMAASFAGPQQIISNTKDPDNSVQTILQPDILQPRRLPFPLAVPSVVKMAMPHPAPVLSAGETRPLVQGPPPPPAWHPPTPHAIEEAAPVRAPDILVAATRVPVFSTPAATYAPQPARPPAPDKPTPPVPATQPAPPKPSTVPPAKTATPSPALPPSSSQQAQAKLPPAPASAPSGSGKDDRNLLVVNAVEIQGTANEQLLAQSEIHGKFEVAPVNVPVGTRSSPGDSSRDKKPGTGAGPAGAATQNSSSAPGSASGQNTGKESGTAPSSSSSTAADGPGRGAGAHDTSAGSAPQGSSASASPFGSITIQGGSSPGGRPGTGATASPPSKSPSSPPAQTGSYGMTIISSGSSGGGLRDFGTFRDGPVYTVYLDVSSIGISGTRWSLQYAAARDARLAHPGALLTPPFPSHQVLPKFPAARVASNLARLFVVQAEIGIEGTLGSIQILQSPDLTLNALLKERLLEWTFRPASMGSDPVSVRVLIGIPIAAVMAQTP